ncbi:MAG: GlsB/YeaQ/YmgE family stress response membrane protein [Actinobacteria bacterium]|nr:GlsB/YeaQ/YmgE family stress response membrane protein [Actinomycetota bacterium]
MGIIGWILLGLIAGAIAKAVHKGDEPGGVLGTMFVGVLGAILGGLIASALGIGAITSFFSIGTWLIAIGGALLLLVIYNMVVSTEGRGRSASSA